MKRILKLGAVFAAMLFISMAFVPAVAADGCVGCEPDCSSCHDEHFVDNVDTDCTSCHLATEIHNRSVSVVELEGREKNKAISEALKNKDIHLLRKALIEDGHTPCVNNAEVTQLTAFEGDETVHIETTVRIPFKAKSGDESEGAILLFTKAEGACAAAAIAYSEHGDPPEPHIVIYSVVDGVVNTAEAGGYWDCIMLCIAMTCAEYWFYCAAGGTSCYLCISGVLPACVTCLASSAFLALYCTALCS
ncbi:MAG: hypothetical protein IB616_01735 [Methanosarcinales archaeon]|nr:MAG: hypothetical protein IB616_01735 [Methanosarcinales archaeon]